MMKRICILATAVSLAASLAMAQDNLVKEKMRAELEQMVAQSKVIGVFGAAMGPAVKGAPYSAVEISESNQMLADGTRIHNESQTTVYRDSEGRMRRETPNQTTIMDPVAGVSYFLNPKTLTATKATLSMPAMYKRIAGPPGATAGSMSETSTFEVRTKDGVTSATVNGKPVDPATIKMDHTFLIDGGRVDEQAFAIANEKMAVEMAAAGRRDKVMAGPMADGGMLRTRVTSPAKTEALGKQMMEGVNADGSRVTTTLEVGTIGNDRPIQLVNERWYSSELQTVIMTKHSDPRTGEDIFRLTNVSRSEPGADLFQVPPSYQINDRK